LNFLFDVTLGRPDVMAKMQSVRVPHKLPVVLSKEDVARLLGATGNLKHQTALSLAYGTGLRVFCFSPLGAPRYLALTARINSLRVAMLICLVM
jgi:site-specific recombinase XerD